MRQRTDARTEGERTYGTHDGRLRVRTVTGPTGTARTGTRWTGTGRSVVVAAAGAVLLLAGCTSGPSSGPDPRPGGGKDAAGNPYWADPDGNAARQVAAYTRDGDARSAAPIRKIARQPVGQGIGSDTPRPR